MNNEQKKQIIKRYSPRRSTIILFSFTIVALPFAILTIAFFAIKNLTASISIKQTPLITLSTPIPATQTASPSATPTPATTPTLSIIPTLRPATPSPSPTPTPIPTATPTPTVQYPLTERVFVVTYYAGHNPNSTFDYTGLANNVASYLNNASRFHGYKDSSSPQIVNFQIVKSTVWQKTADQNGSNCNQYLSRVQSGNWSTSDWQSTNCWGSGTANYNTMLSENNVCSLINSNQIDEVWFLGFGNAGFWEANMTGNGAFWTNGPVVGGTSCNRPTHIMGFNYELTPDYALHSFGHRIEGVMNNFSSSDFSQFNIYAPNGNSSCGTVHFPPNGTKDYDYSNQTSTNSDCENWNVNHTGARTSINCSTWGCSQQGYMTWWMQNIPSDWWHYIVNK